MTKPKVCDRCGRPLKAQQKRFCSRNCAHLFAWRPRRNDVARVEKGTR